MPESSSIKELETKPKKVCGDKHASNSADVDWLSQISAWKRSGLSQRVFCEQNHLNIHSFIHQRHKLMKERKSKSVNWLPVKQIPSPNLATPSQSNNCTNFILYSSNGMKLSIPSQADAATLKILLLYIEQGSSAC